MSIVSLVELIEFIWDLIYYTSRKRNNYDDSPKEKNIAPLYLLVEDSAEPFREGILLILI